MQEDEQDTYRTDELYQEDIEMEYSDITQRTIVCKLVAHNLMRHKPTDEDAGEEAHNRQEQLSGNKIEEVKDCHTEQLVVMPGT